MISEADVKKYMEIQAQGIPIPAIANLVSVADAVKLVGKTKNTVLLARAENPAAKDSKLITWFIIGSIVMLDKASLIRQALRRGWIEEV